MTPREDELDDRREPVTNCDRRGFLRVLGAAGAGLALTPAAMAQAEAEGDPYGVLVDTTMCMGCQTCTKVCAEGHGLPAPEEVCRSDTTTTQLSVVDSYTFPEERVEMGGVFVKRQCMHCLQPACASACLTKALLKTDEGPVVWRGSKCMGCRYCMLSCPFGMPKFEYDSPNPRIQKCDMCADRLAEGQPPRCVENCPAGALTFGRRSELIEEAHRRIAEAPDDYYHHIYGEREAGGTSWLYLAKVPFEELGFPKEVETESYPAMTKEFLYGVPVVLTLVPPLLLGISKAVASERPEGGAAR
ncbi:MAG: 4Fe-4S dicluster domain-containing protein [Planctomycetes bacterium]|nr:4Fe-4S dicluster domain-containing protein [Planctomycetota bacterium]